MATATRCPDPDIKVLYDVPYRVYVDLVDVSANRHLKMAYHDGTLEIVSPRLRLHEEPAVKLRTIVVALARRFRIPYHCSAGATFRKAGVGIFKGVGKEPDESFFFANVARVPRGRDVDLDAGDPPPDLWIEVDNRSSSAGKLPSYAALGVPEVWRFRSRSGTLRFLRLNAGVYERIEASSSLPMLTPALVREALALGNNPLDYVWDDLFFEWLEKKFPVPTSGS